MHELEEEVYTYLESKNILPVVFFGVFNNELIGFTNGNLVDKKYEEAIHKILADLAKNRRKTNV